MSAKKKALGRGLSAILESPDTDITSKDISGSYVVGAIADIPIDNIETNPFQPRDEYEEESLSELAESIKQQGIIQPITVRKLGYDKYQLISGERRLRASKIAGFTHIPSYIRVANDQQMLEMALVENIQREQLNPIEIAIGYIRLVEECKLTQEQLSEKVGKKRSTIANYIRLLKLPVEIQIALRDKQISMGHARALINISEPESQVYLLSLIVEKELSVREVEKIVRNLHTDPLKKYKKLPVTLPDHHREAKDLLAEKFKTKVEMKRNTKGKGNIVISFENDEDFKRILLLLSE